MLARAGLRHHLRHPWQAALAVLGVALGVAVVVAVDLANHSAERAFTRSAEALSGEATHRIRAGTPGIEESLYATLRLAGVRSATPVVEGFVNGPQGRPLRLLGVDPWAEAGVRNTVSAALSEVTIGEWLDGGREAVLFATDAQRLGLAPGDQFAVEALGRSHRLRLAAVATPHNALAAEGLRETLLVDLATAQELLNRIGRLDRIDLLVPDDADRAQHLAQIESFLPSGVVLGSATEGVAVLDEMTAAFRLNLTAFSLLALLVGALLIYNAISFSVVQRRALLGRLRAIGVGRGQLFRSVVVEGVLLGAVGTLLGMLLGYLLAHVLLDLVTRTITDLYFVVSVRGVVLSPGAVAMALLLGLLASLVAAALPAWEAASVAPRTALQQIALEGRAQRLAAPAAALGGACMACGAALLFLHGGGLVVGFIGLFAVLVGAALIVPWAVHMLAGWIALPAGWLFGVPGRMAARGVATGLARSGVAATALVVAITAVVGVSIMIDSFRGSLATWLDTTLAADVYVSRPSHSGEGPPPVDPRVAERLAAVDGVYEVATAGHLRVPSDRGEIRLRTYEHGRVGDVGMRYKAREANAWERFVSGQAAYITEPFSAHQGLEVGDTLLLKTPQGDRQLPIAAVVYDYTTSQGAVLVGRAFYTAHWDDGRINSFAVYLQTERSTPAVIDDLHAAVADLEPLRMRSNKEIRTLSLEIFDRTFAVTQVLRLLATVVAAAGVFGALLALSLERTAEVAVLRALGMTPFQVWGLELSRSALLGALAGLLALPPGWVLAVALTKVINERAFGWSLALEIDPWVFVHAFGLAIVAALLAGVYPAWRASRTPPGEAMRDDSG